MSAAAPGSFAALASSLQGEVIQPADSGYEIARQVWNGMIDKRPAAVVRAVDTADVIAAIAFARTQGLSLAIRGGAHNVAGNATCDGGIVLDLSPMKSIRVDPRNRTVHAEGGVLWRELDRETQAFQLATPGGAISTTGIAGLTLGGGFGYLSRRYGLVCDNLVSVEVVTADGAVLTASSEENAELFWGLRGGGGNFGVVTSFKYRLHPLDGVLGGLIAFPFDMAAAVLKRYREVSATAPDELCMYAGLLPGPGGGKIAGIVVGFAGTERDGLRAIQPLRDLGSILMDTVSWIPYCQLQQQLDASYPKGLRNYWKSGFLAEVSDDLIELLVESVASAPSPLDHMVIEPWGGAISRVPRDETAFDYRSARYNLLILAVGTDPKQDAANVDWARRLWHASRRFSSGGSYVNYLGADEDAHIAYRDEKYERLAVLKRAYDPQNVFRLNQNIGPS